MDEVKFCFGVLVLAPPVLTVVIYYTGVLCKKVWKHFFPPKNTLKWEDDE